MIYNQPLYYEIAFSFVNPKKQVDNFEKIIKKFSKIKVKRFLDIACGPALQLREIAKRGYEAIGLDLSRKMLGYLKRKAKKEGIKIEAVEADMTKFKLKNKADFAFIMMGSLVVKSNDEFLSHLDSVALSLNKGGLYFIQNKYLDYEEAKASWKMEKDGIKVKTTYKSDFKNALNQIYAEKITLEVNDNGKRRKFINKRDVKFIFPQEFKTLVEFNNKFEFLGWWKATPNVWDLNKPLEKAKNLNGNIILLRKK